MGKRNHFDLTDQVAIITGGHSWLGYDMACALASAGCHIIIAARNKEKSVVAADRIKEKYQVETKTIILDQCDFDQVKKMAEEAYNWKGHIDILINNAGGGSGSNEGDFLKRSPEDVKSLICTNLLGPIFCCQQVGVYMIRQNKGKIINIGSIAGVLGRDRRMYRKNSKMEQPVDYAASKAGIIGMTRDLAAYMSPYHIQVNCISPGGFDKGDLPEGFVSDYADGTIEGRMGRFGEDIYGTILFLASSASNYMTGQNLMLDGGFSIYK